MQTRIALPAIFAGVVMSFIAATAFVHWELSAIDGAAAEISEDAAPGIEHLAAARSDLRHMHVMLRRDYDPAAIEDSRRVFDRSIDGYLNRPILPGDQTIWAGVYRSKAALDAALQRYELDRNAAAVPPVIAVLSDAITEAMESSAEHTRKSALRIRQMRSESSHVALGLDVVCTLIAILGAFFVHRLSQAERELETRRGRLQEERATELEDFSGRIAHDILSPLGAIGFALDLLRRTDESLQRGRIVDRGTSALERIQRLVTGLLDFARAGGKPSAGATADVLRVIADLVAELEPAAAEKGVTLTTHQDGHLEAACNAGVLTSLIANLARNAIKYIGDAPERRIEIRALDRGNFVRIEVIDTGPGLDHELQQRVFDPYVRATKTTEPGVGLGLATVKRLAEAHGGRVGLESEPGKGATFWFEVPLCQDRVTDEDDPARSGGRVLMSNPSMAVARAIPTPNLRKVDRR